MHDYIRIEINILIVIHIFIVELSWKVKVTKNIRNKRTHVRSETRTQRHIMGS